MIRRLSIGLLGVFAVSSCGEKEDKDDTTVPETVGSEQPGKSDPGEPADGQNNPAAPTEVDVGFSVTGQLALGKLALTGVSVTHVVALNVETDRSFAVAVDQASGEFKIPLVQNGLGQANKLRSLIRADGTVDRDGLVQMNPKVQEEIAGKTDAEIAAFIEANVEQTIKDSGGNEPTPWILSYVDATKVGAEMLVSRFAASTLDSLAPERAATGQLKLGVIGLGADGKATQEASYDDILSSTGLSQAAAQVLGAADDVCMRYINPDINNDGVLDAPVIDNSDHAVEGGRSYTLDFHNRFNLIKLSDNSQLSHTMYKNAWPDEVAGGLQNLDVKYTGSGIIPEMEKAWFAETPRSYKWKFTSGVELSQSGSCSEDSALATLPADQWCSLSYTEDPNYERYQLGIEVKQPPEGTYILEVGDQTYTWTQVKVSDFSAGEGMLILLVKYLVDEKGTADVSDDALSGIEYKYLRRSNGDWTPAEEDALKVLIKGEGGYVSMHFSPNDQQCGLTVPKQPSGSVLFTDAEVNCHGNVTPETADLVKSGNIPWDRFTGSGVSYDDKMGMRFFF